MSTSQVDFQHSRVNSILQSPVRIKRSAPSIINNLQDINQISYKKEIAPTAHAAQSKLLAPTSSFVAKLREAKKHPTEIKSSRFQFGRAPTKKRPPLQLTKTHSSKSQAEKSEDNELHSSTVRTLEKDNESLKSSFLEPATQQEFSSRNHSPGLHCSLKSSKFNSETFSTGSIMLEKPNANANSINTQQLYGFQSESRDLNVIKTDPVAKPLPTFRDSILAAMPKFKIMPKLQFKLTEEQDQKKANVFLDSTPSSARTNMPVSPFAMTKAASSSQLPSMPSAHQSQEPLSGAEGQRRPKFRLNFDKVITTPTGSTSATRTETDVNKAGLVMKVKTERREKRQAETSLEEGMKRHKIFSIDKTGFFDLNQNNPIVKLSQTPVGRKKKPKITKKTLLDEVKGNTQRYSEAELVRYFDEFGTKIIQPRFMENIGSMCITELWPNSNKLEYLKWMRGGINIHRQRHKEGENLESLFQPARQQKNQLVKEHVDSNRRGLDETYDTVINPDMRSIKRQQTLTTQGNVEPSSSAFRSYLLKRDASKESPVSSQRTRFERQRSSDSPIVRTSESPVGRTRIDSIVASRMMNTMSRFKTHELAVKSP